MSVSLTRNLRLKVSSDLNPDSRYNLERIDSLAGNIQSTTGNGTLLRSVGDIQILPESADIGGTGIGGILTIGSANQLLTSVTVYTSVLTLSTSLGLRDTAATGTKSLVLKYKSDINGLVDLITDRTLSLDLDGADRSLVLAGNLNLQGGDIALTTPSSSAVTLPLTGTLSTLAGVETLTNKIISASSNTISGIVDANISVGAAIDGTKILSTFGAQPVETSERIRFTNGSNTTSLRQAASGQTQNIAFFLPPALGTTGQVLATDSSGNLSWADSTAAALSGLSDVDIGTPTNGEFLVYDSVSSKWINTNPAETYSWLTSDGSTKTINHNLNTTNVSVSLFEVSSGDTIEVDTITRTNSSTITLIASQAPPSTWTVLLQGRIQP